jgi:serine/threonine protein kinase
MSTITSEMTTMQPFSPPFVIEKKAKRYGCYIDVGGAPYEASWRGNWAIFDFTNTSQISDFNLKLVSQSTELSTAWQSSRQLAFGSHASVRVGETVPFPVVKIAHPTNKFRQLIERECFIMRDLAAVNAVAQVADEPLADEDGIFGFRLERLYYVELEDLQRRFKEVSGLLETLHDAGYCHGDCSFSNIMQNKEGRLVLIDLAFAGRLGSEIPEGFPKHLFRRVPYTTNVDLDRVKKWAKP